MHAFTAVFAASSLLAMASGSPLYARSGVCGAAPSASGTNNQPMNQPTGIQTAAACQAQCNAKSGCQSFCFGLIDNTIQCKLYSCAASAIPVQTSANLVVYDKACSAVPSVVPTKSNPTGKAENKKESSTKTTNSKTYGSKTDNTKADNTKADTTKADTTKTKDSKKTIQQRSINSQHQANGSAKKTSSNANTCGSKPAGTANNKPIDTPTVSSVNACKAKCAANPNCKSFTYGTVNKAMVCQLYSVAASAIPVPSNAEQKKALIAYDIGCSI